MSFFKKLKPYKWQQSETQSGEDVNKINVRVKYFNTDYDDDFEQLPTEQTVKRVQRYENEWDEEQDKEQEVENKSLFQWESLMKQDWLCLISLLKVWSSIKVLSF